MKTRIEGSDGRSVMGGRLLSPERQSRRSSGVAKIALVVGLLATMAVFTASSAPAAQAAPQLFVDLTASTLHPAVGQPVQFEVVVENRGDAEMQSVVVLLYANGTEGPITLVDNKSLAAHSQWTFQFDYKGYSQAVLYQTLAVATANPADGPLRAARPLTIEVQPDGN